MYTNKMNEELILTFNPNNLAIWKENYITYAKANFKFAGDMLQKQKVPQFISNPLEPPAKMPKSKSFEFITLSNRINEENLNRREFNSMLEKLTGDLMMHLSP